METLGQHLENAVGLRYAWGVKRPILYETAIGIACLILLILGEPWAKY